MFFFTDDPLFVVSLDYLDLFHYYLKNNSIKSKRMLIYMLHTFSLNYIVVLIAVSVMIDFILMHSI